MNELPLFNEGNTSYSSVWIRYASIKTPLICKSFKTGDKNAIYHPWIIYHLQKNDLPPHLLISIASEEKKDESTN